MAESTGRNNGIAILRVLLAFSVILFHCWSGNGTEGIRGWIYYIECNAVPTFMFLAFFFFQPHIASGGTKKLTGRIQRVIIPQVFWAVIYWIVYFGLDMAFGYGLQSGIVDMFWQAITGNSPNLNKTMWYQADIIVITVIFAAAAQFLRPKRRDRIILLLALVALFMQYSGLNEQMFTKCRYEIMYPAGRLMEMIPYSATGYFVAKSGIMAKVGQHRFEAMVGAVGIILLTKCFEVFQVPPGFFYQGVSHVFISFAIFLFFYALPLDGLPIWLNTTVSYLTKYTLGIYCMHRMVAAVVNKLVYDRAGITNANSFYECVLLYVVCYVIAFVIDKIPCKVFSKAVN